MSWLWLCVVGLASLCSPTRSADLSIGKGRFISEEDDICCFGSWHKNANNKILRMDLGNRQVLYKEDGMKTATNDSDGIKKCTTTDYSYTSLYASLAESPTLGTYAFTKPLPEDTYKITFAPAFGTIVGGEPGENAAFIYTNSTGSHRGMDWIRKGDRGYDRLWIDDLDTSTEPTADWQQIAGCDEAYSSPAELRRLDCADHFDAEEKTFDLSKMVVNAKGKLRYIKADGSMNPEMLATYYQDPSKKLYRMDCGDLNHSKDNTKFLLTTWVTKDDKFYMMNNKDCRVLPSMNYQTIFKEIMAPKRLQWMGNAEIKDVVWPEEAKGVKVKMYAGYWPKYEDWPEGWPTSQLVLYLNESNDMYLGYDWLDTANKGYIRIWLDEFSTEVPAEEVFTVDESCMKDDKTTSGAVLTKISVGTVALCVLVRLLYQVV